MMSGLMIGYLAIGVVVSILIGVGNWMASNIDGEEDENKIPMSLNILIHTAIVVGWPIVIIRWIMLVREERRG
jgi:hypothetical protein